MKDLENIHRVNENHVDSEAGKILKRYCVNVTRTKTAYSQIKRKSVIGNVGSLFKTADVK